MGRTGADFVVGAASGCATASVARCSTIVATGTTALDGAGRWTGSGAGAAAGRVATARICPIVHGALDLAAGGAARDCFSCTRRLAGGLGFLQLLCLSFSSLHHRLGE